MSQKTYYTILGYLLLAINITLIDTRFNILGVGFGIIGAITLVKAIRIKK